MNDDDSENANDIEPGIDDILSAIDPEQAQVDYKRMTDPYAKDAA